MQPREVAALLSAAALLDGRLERQLADPEAASRAITRWTAALDGVPATLPDGTWDVGRAVRRYYERRGGDQSAQYRPVEPHDILAAWAPVRADVLRRHVEPAPDADPDDPVAYRRQLAADRAAVATGRRPPVTIRELTSGPAADVDLTGVGRRIPPAAAAALEQYRPRRTARQTADGRSDQVATRQETSS